MVSEQYVYLYVPQLFFFPYHKYPVRRRTTIQQKPWLNQIIFVNASKCQTVYELLWTKPPI